eukprot:scaffold71848_cov14-Tisochrysis_lutea.AAC.1
MQSLANLVYALTVLMDVAPHQDWMSHFFAASLPHLQAASGAELVQVDHQLSQARAGEFTKGRGCAIDVLYCPNECVGSGLQLRVWMRRWVNNVLVNSLHVYVFDVNSMYVLNKLHRGEERVPPCMMAIKPPSLCKAYYEGNNRHRGTGVISSCLKGSLSGWIHNLGQVVLALQLLSSNTLELPPRCAGTPNAFFKCPRAAA